MILGSRHARLRERRIRERLVHLVRTPSVTGDEDACVGRIATWLQEAGAEVEYWNDGMTALLRDPRYPGHEVERAWLPIAAGVVRGRRPGPTVMLTGHTDVVPPTNFDQWDHEPFSGIVLDDDRLYGRGASDMKSGLVAAMEVFLAFVEGDRDFPGRVIFLAVPAEEDSGLGTLAAIRRDWTADLIIIPEPTARGGEPEIVVAQAGAMTVLVEVEGRSAHASTRRAGENALEHFLPLFHAIREHEAEANATIVNPVMKDIPLPYPNNVGTIEGGEWASSVMDALTVSVRVAVPVGHTVAESFARFERAIAEAAKRDPWLREHPPQVTCHAAGFGSSATPADHPLVERLADATEAVTDRRSSVVGAPFGCDMAAWIRHTSTPCVLYGPGDIELAHAVNEWVSLDKTVESAHVLLEAVERLLELDPKVLREQNAELFGAAAPATHGRRAAQ